MKAEIYSPSGVLLRVIECTKIQPADSILGWPNTVVMNGDAVVATIPKEYCVITLITEIK